MCNHIREDGQLNTFVSYSGSAQIHQYSYNKNTTVSFFFPSKLTAYRLASAADFHPADRRFAAPARPAAVR